MYKVVYLPTAQRQLEDAVLYIAADSLMREMDEAVRQLEEMPHRFPIYHTLYAVKREIRFFPVKRYNVCYVIDESRKAVEIWRVLHRLRRQDCRE